MPRSTPHPHALVVNLIVARDTVGRRVVDHLRTFLSGDLQAAGMPPLPVTIIAPVIDDAVMLTCHPDDAFKAAKKRHGEIMKAAGTAGVIVVPESPLLVAAGLARSIGLNTMDLKYDDLEEAIADACRDISAMNLVVRTANPIDEIIADAFDGFLLRHHLSSHRLHADDADKHARSIEQQAVSAIAAEMASRLTADMLHADQPAVAAAAPTGPAQAASAGGGDKPAGLPGLPPGGDCGWPVSDDGYRYCAVLDDRRSIADFIEEHAPYEVDKQMVEENYHDSKAVLRLVPITALQEARRDANMRDESREAQHRAMDPSTMPPLMVEDGVVVDGNHRLRVARSLGLDALWCYAIVDKDTPVPAMSMASVSEDGPTP